MALDLAEAKSHFEEHGYVLLPGYLSAEELRPSQATISLLFPTPEEFHADPAGTTYQATQRFPYKAVEWSLLSVCEPLVQLGELLLGRSDIRLKEGHNWVKFTDAAEYDQKLHRDYGNHTILAPTTDAAFGEVEMFIWINDVAEDAGPTHVVSRTVTEHLRPSMPEIAREEAPEIYASEVSAAGPAGTVLAYRNDTFHRGTAMTAPGGARYALKVSFGAPNPYWVDKLALLQTCVTREWYDFVNRATPRMLEVLGFPPSGNPYWTPTTYAGVARRYPDADLSAFEPSGALRPRREHQGSSSTT